MRKDDLVDVLCPEDWSELPPKEFQRKVGSCLHYLLDRDQKNTKVRNASSFLGGIVGGILTVIGTKISGV